MLVVSFIGYNTLMAIIVMLSWWYSQGWLWVINITINRLKTVSRVFAVKVLLKTWFSPWKQIYQQANFRNFLRIAVDNGVSRFIGGIIRTVILLWALILSLVIILVGIISLIIWPMLPLMTFILPVIALKGGL